MQASRMRHASKPLLQANHWVRLANEPLLQAIHRVRHTSEPLLQASLILPQGREDV